MTASGKLEEMGTYGSPPGRGQTSGCAFPPSHIPGGWMAGGGVLSVTVLGPAFSFSASDRSRFHRLDGVQVVLDVLVLAAFDRAVRLVHAVPKIVHKHSVNSQDGIFVALRLHDVAHGQCSNVTAVFEISRVERFQAHFVENLAALGPFRKHLGGSAAVAPVMYSSLLYSLVPRMIPF